MNKKEKRPIGYWTLEKCKEAALQYTTKTMFAINDASAYNRAVKKKWIEDICSHMTGNYTERGFWTYDRYKEEALKYSTRHEFFSKSQCAYKTARKENKLDEVCAHMKRGIPIRKIKWTYEKCKDLASVCKNGREMKMKEAGAETASRRNNWLGEFFPKQICETV